MIYYTVLLSVDYRVTMNVVITVSSIGKEFRVRSSISTEKVDGCVLILNRGGRYSMRKHAFFVGHLLSSFKKIIEDV